MNSGNWAVASPWFFVTVAAAAMCLALVCRNRALTDELRRRMHIKATLREKLAFQSAMLDGIPYAVCVRDAEARLIFCNAAFERLFDIRRSAMIGKAVSESGLDFVEPARMRALHQCYLKLLNEGGNISQDTSVSLHGESRRLLHWATSIPQLSEAGPRALVAGAIDITDRHQLIQQIAEALAKAEEANRAKSSFLATMSHEIRTPMNAVMGMLELLARQGRLASRDQDSIEVARTSARSLLGIIDDILDISKIDAGGLEIHPAPARLRSIVDEVVRVFASLAQQSGLAIEVELDPALAEWHSIDAVRFRQIASNLLSNAIKYTDTGRVTVRLRSAARVADIESIVLEVEDTGIGIKPDDLANLFRPFFQAESAGPRAIGGTGLGLPIVQRLCVLMGGSVNVASELGVGTRVRASFDVPAVPAPPDWAIATQADDRAIDAAPSWQGRRVLAVDDHPANRLLMQRQLEHLGLACDLAENGESALALWRGGGFDLVITDCSMPVMDGYRLTAAIREAERSEGLQRTPILGCTAHVQEEERRHALQVGMDDCLMKPFSLGALLTALHRHLPDGPSGAPGASPGSEAQGPVRKAAYDPAALRSISDGDVRVEKQFLQTLLRTNLSDLRAIVVGFGNGHRAEVAALAHKIKGAARMVQAWRVIEACEALERAIADEPTAPLDEALAELVDSVDAFDEAIRTQLAGMD
ncbi:response regulator [Variovorax sp. J22P168]|uniref:ATP-binding protein n=1 Tax=Variovorax jilinensis TaxID=3053513 RepID=UPI00257872B1|nr:ATP-binding protein [Variovorax sp. J22P168]MDM0011584.1 response regulator [Variovorax sp. J22P168]